MAEGGVGEGTAGAAPGGSASAPRDVFLSHASHDRAIALELASHLEKQGIGVWMAPRDVVPGTLYADAIVRAITDAKVLVLVLSEHSLASGHVSKEVERASSKKRPIIALRIDAAPLTPAFEYFLSESHWVDLASVRNEVAFANLADGIRRLLSPATAGAPPPPRGGTAPAAAEPSTGLFGRRRRPRERSTAVRLAVIGLIALIVGTKEVERLLHPKPPAPPVPSAAAPAASAEPSIAVLPFTDMSQAKDQEYFADGMAEEILDLLAKVPSLKVIARTSSFQFKGKNEDVRTVAEKLGVATVLEGSVRKAGNKLRITAQLIHAADGSHLWSETYDREISDVFRTQDEIAGAVVAALKVSLLGRAAPKSTPTSNSEAYGLYLKGRLLDHRYNQTDAAAAQALFRQALALDPNFAPAWAALASSLSSGQMLGATDDISNIRSTTLEAARRALELDPSNVEAHLAIGGEYWFVSANFEAARREFAAVRELDPGNPAGLATSALMALSTGHADEAIAFARRALDRDPLEIDNYRILGTALYFNGALEEADSVFRRAIELNPLADGIHVRLAFVLRARGQLDAMQEMAEREPSVLWRRVGLALAYSTRGRSAEADRALDTILRNEAGWPYQLAEIYAVRRAPDKVFEWLNRAVAEHDPGLVNYVRLDPVFRDYRSDPRFAALLDKLNLPES